MLDTDADGVVDAADNCPFEWNDFQTDSNSDGIGDVCQCGDVTGDGFVDALDVTAVRSALADPLGASLSPSGDSRCVVSGEGSPCDLVQVAVLLRHLEAKPPGIEQVCAPALP